MRRSCLLAGLHLLLDDWFGWRLTETGMHLGDEAKSGRFAVAAWLGSDLLVAGAIAFQLRYVKSAFTHGRTIATMLMKGE